jgi:uncharacterized glyoxalase superfamily protein PhnB
MVISVDATADYCRSAGCTVTTGPVNAPWGERYVECLDPYEYAWKFFQLLACPPPDSLNATRNSCFA